MTMIIDENKKCANCGQETTYSVLLSTNNFGSNDLDTRPTGMARYELNRQIQICPKCGYANYDISEFEYENSKEIFNTKKSQKIITSNLPQTAKGYTLIAMMGEQNKDYERAGFSYLYAAWICDDNLENNLAIKSRKKAIKNFLQVLKEKDVDELKTILLDLYRRTNNYKKVKKYANSIKFINNDETFRILKKYQIILSENKDNKCHDLDEAELTVYSKEYL